MELADSLFRKFSKLVFDKTGINLHSGKKQLLKARIGKIIRQKKIATYLEYYDFICKDKTDEALLEFINAISTNTTFFFREEKHFEFMKNTWANQIHKNRPVKIWCAASSSGEEPYSIAITANEIFEGQNVKIVASDIDTNMLKKAKSALYELNKVDKLPKTVLRNNFLKGKNEYKDFVKVKKHLRQLIDFRKVNLIENFSFDCKFDLIFCRNVMIYFKPETKTQIVNRMHNYLNPNGYLFIGHSETLNGITDKYKYVQPAIYQKI